MCAEEKTTENKEKTVSEDWIMCACVCDVFVCVCLKEWRHVHAAKDAGSSAGKDTRGENREQGSEKERGGERERASLEKGEIIKS